VAQEVESERHPAKGAARKFQHVDMIEGLHDNYEDHDVDGEIASMIYLLLLPLNDICV
jgi:hypothetical protein